MELKGKLVSQTNVKNADLYFEIFRYRPNDLSRISPEIIKHVDLCGGRWGDVGSVVGWTYIQDGEPVVGKETVEAVDEGKKSITYKVIEGDLLQVYKNIRTTLSVDTTGKDNIVTWTLEYEKSEGGPEPSKIMDLLLAFNKDIERQHSYLVPN